MVSELEDFLSGCYLFTVSNAGLLLGTVGLLFQRLMSSCFLPVKLNFNL